MESWPALEGAGGEEFGMHVLGVEGAGIGSNDLLRHRRKELENEEHVPKAMEHEILWSFGDVEEVGCLYDDVVV